MAITYYVPRAPLNAAVAAIWHCEGYVLPHAWERMMPTCGVTLLVNLQDDELRWRDLDGGVPSAAGHRHLRAAATAVRNRHGTTAVHHGSRVRVDRRPAGCWECRSMSWRRATWGWRICGGATPDDCSKQLVERPRRLPALPFLRPGCSSGRASGARRATLVSRALALLEGMSVAAVTRQLGVVPKRLIRAFKSEVGLAPKRYCRIRRFERLLSDIEQAREVDWAATAARHGYYDQAHLIHEFRELSSYTPLEYLARRGPYARHVPLG